MKLYKQLRLSVYSFISRHTGDKELELQSNTSISSRYLHFSATRDLPLATAAHPDLASELESFVVLTMPSRIMKEKLNSLQRAYQSAENIVKKENAAELEVVNKRLLKKEKEFNARQLREKGEFLGQQETERKAAEKAGERKTLKLSKIDMAHHKAHK